MKYLLFLIVLFWGSFSNAQFNGCAPGFCNLATSTPATFSLVAHTTTTQGTNGVSPAINTSAANFIALCQSDGTGAPTDSEVNTWIPLTAQGSSQLYYCSPCIVGANHTFTAAVTLGSMQIQAWSGAASASPFDVQNGATSFSSTTAPNAASPVTPSVANELILTCLQWNSADATPATISSGFTISDQKPFDSGVAYGSAMAYQVQTTIVTPAPIWTLTSVVFADSVLGTFRP